MILRLLLLIVLPLVGLAGPAGAQTPELVLEDGEKELVIMRGPRAFQILKEAVCWHGLF